MEEEVFPHGCRTRLSRRSRMSFISSRCATVSLTITHPKISFCVSPAAAALALGLRTSLDQVLLTVFALCGLLRLARFNVTTGSVPHDASGKAKYFEGLPTPTSLGIVTLLAFWVSRGWIGSEIPLGTVEFLGAEFHPVTLIFVAHGCAMISKTMQVPKP